MIVREKEAITLIGGARVARADLDAALRLAPVVVAADSGADTALEAGLMPRAVIGDFDSISAATRARLPDDILHPLDDQDSTDFDKCLKHIDAPLIIGLGFTGDRLDHQMAACNALVRHAGRRCVLLGAHDLMFLCPPVLDLPLEPGCRVSLFPMGAVEGASDGLEWPIGGINFAPDGRIGTSNRTVGPLNLSVTAPKMLVIAPADTLGTVARALTACTAIWSPA
ncbi:MAG: thiamine diphosphokinase [Roseovarius sp.]|uniref:thiamine diphosphokinase n=1 Tax=Roseovarius sp. TaxID=1486281 RepID=UPI004057F7DE